jgi:uncharacterized DUF497 family protein
LRGLKWEKVTSGGVEEAIRKISARKKNGKEKKLM